MKGNLNTENMIEAIFVDETNWKKINIKTDKTETIRERRIKKRKRHGHHSNARRREVLISKHSLERREQ